MDVVAGCCRLQTHRRIMVNFDRPAMAIKSRYTLLNREQAWHSEYQMLPSDSPSELA